MCTLQILDADGSSLTPLYDSLSRHTATGSISIGMRMAEEIGL